MKNLLLKKEGLLKLTLFLNKKIISNFKPRVRKENRESKLQD